MKEIRVVNVAEGIAHRGFLFDGIVYTAESCNTDQIVDKRVVAGTALAAIGGPLPRACERCLGVEA